MRIFISVLLTIFLSACASSTSNQTTTQTAAYAMPDRYAAQVVEQVLRDGGNAIDASIAAAFVLSVTFPEAGNIGGGGFMLARMSGKNHFLDYREKAPLAASRDMYLDANGGVIDKASLIGIRAAGVPGTVAGLWTAHQKFGTKPWSELVKPAISFAEAGFQVHPKKASQIAKTIEWFNGATNFADYFGDMQKGEIFKQPALAKVLKRIAQQGRNDFYVGETAKLLVDHMQRDGGLITAQDLAQYQAVWRTPLVSDWMGLQVVTAPPPSSGGFAIIQLLGMKEHLNSEFSGLEHNSPQYVHLIAEMEKRVFADRAEYFGDPDFVDIPMQTLISDDYITRRAKEVNVNAISQLEHAQPGIDSPSTTHFSILDQWGNAVSNTYTINWSYGSGMVVEDAGFILNNEMDDFSTKPGTANVYGVIGGAANEIQPSKRMLSSMSPTILLDKDQVRMIVGTPGGSTIFTSVFQGIVNVMEHGMTAAEAVNASRFHHQLLPPDLVTMSISVPLSEKAQQGLRDKGYRIEPHDWEFGDIQMINRINGKVDAASDTRGIGVSGVVKQQR